MAVLTVLRIRVTFSHVKFWVGLDLGLNLRF